MYGFEHTELNFDNGMRKGFVTLLQNAIKSKNHQTQNYLSMLDLNKRKGQEDFKNVLFTAIRKKNVTDVIGCLLQYAELKNISTQFANEIADTIRVAIQNDSTGVYKADTLLPLIQWIGKYQI